MFAVAVFRPSPPWAYFLLEFLRAYVPGPLSFSNCGYLPTESLFNAFPHERVRVIKNVPHKINTPVLYWEYLIIVFYLQFQRFHVLPDFCKEAVKVLFAFR